MRNELQAALMAAKEMPAIELPRLLGELEEIRCTAMSRLTASPPAQQSDELLDTSETARRLGISTDFLYRNHHQLTFTRRVGRRLLFSAIGVDKYMRQQTSLTAKQQ